MTPVVPLAMSARVENPGRHYMVRQSGQPRAVGWRLGERIVKEDVKERGIYDLADFGPQLIEGRPTELRFLSERAEGWSRRDLREIGGESFS